MSVPTILVVDDHDGGHAPLDPTRTSRPTGPR